MDQQELQQKIAEYYSRLPKEAQEVFSSMAWLETLKNISEKWGLNDEQTKTLGTETTLALLGIIDLDEFKTILRNELGLSIEVTGKLLTEIDNVILNPIRGQLSATFEKNNTEPVEKEPKLEDRFANLPKNVRDSILQINYQQTLYEIGKDNDLNVGQMGIVEEATANIILGSAKAERFEDTLKNRLGLEEEKIRKIVSEVNEKVLRRIREEMKEGTVSHDQIFKSAGIKIVDAGDASSTADSGEKPNLLKPDLSVPELTAPSTEIPKPPTVTPPSMLGQKFAGSFQIPTVKTEYTVPNVTKGKNENPVPKNKGVDPYREPVE